MVLRKSGYDEKGKFVLWVIQIAHNLIMDYFRISKKRYLFSKINDNSNLGDILLNEFIEIDELLNSENKYKIVKKLIDEKLLPEQKLVLELRFYEKMSFREIAVIQKVNSITALGRYRYAINNLRKELKNYNT